MRQRNLFVEDSSDNQDQHQSSEQPAQVVDPNQTKNSKKQRKKSSPFVCKCGKNYGSLAAVHTHINNKHSDNDKMNKQYKNAIKNPQKINQGQSTSIRMKDIKFNKCQADLMIHVDTTLKDIYEQWMNVDKQKAKTKLIQQQDYLDSFSQFDDDQNEEYQSKRDVRIRQKLQQYKKELGIVQINKLINHSQQFKIVKLDRFRLGMKPQMAKFFIDEVAVDIMLTLEIVSAIKNPTITEDFKIKLLKVQGQIWKGKQKIGEILQKYYNEWMNKITLQMRKIK